MTGSSKNVDENERLFVVSATDDDSHIHSQIQVRIYLGFLGLERSVAKLLTPDGGF